VASILVTGGRGFIGRHLCRRLVEDGHRVTVLDDLSNAGAPVEEVDQVDGDVRDGALVRRLVDASALVYHLAAVSSVSRSLEDWSGTHAANVSGLINVLDAARARRVPIIYASSAAVYGNQADGPIEETAATVPLSAYGVDKLAAEGHAGVAGRLFGVPSLGLRFFNVYGPGQMPGSPYSGVISRFVDLARRGEPLPLNGGGYQTRDFIYVEDVIAALVLAVERTAPAAPVVNICSGRGVTVAALAREVNALAGNQAGTVEAPPRPGDIGYSIGAPDRARDLLGFTAWTPFAEGLVRTLNWMESA
jgi:UDP-glucose 4-epimerase